MGALAALLVACGSAAPATVPDALARLPTGLHGSAVLWSTDRQDPPAPVPALLRAAAVTPEQVDALLLTPPPVSVLLRTDAPGGPAIAALTTAGYLAGSPPDGGPAVLHRGPRAPAALAGLPAIAVDQGWLFAGDTADAEAFAAGDVATPAWAGPLLAHTDPAATVLLGPGTDPLPGLGSGGNADRPPAGVGVTVPLPAYDGFALTRGPDGTGVVVVSYGDRPVTDGPAIAQALAVRAATATFAARPATRVTDRFRGGAPRWLQGQRLAVLPVSWSGDDADLLTDVAGGLLAFLASRS